jgi:hypothetical protein
MQYHPLAYIIKLSIEMSMAELITKFAHFANHPAAVLRPSGKTSVWPDDLNRVKSHTEKSSSNNKADMAMKPADSAGWSGNVSSFNIAAAAAAATALKRRRDSG